MAPSRYAPSCSRNTRPRTFGLSMAVSTSAHFWSGNSAAELGDGVDRVERVGHDEVVAVLDGGPEVVLEGADVRRLVDVRLDAELGAALGEALGDELQERVDADRARC